MLGGGHNSEGSYMDRPLTPDRAGGRTQVVHAIYLPRVKGRSLFWGRAQRSGVAWSAIVHHQRISIYKIDRVERITFKQAQIQPSLAPGRSTGF